MGKNGERRRVGAGALLVAATASACAGSNEDIRVRDRDRLLWGGRAQLRRTFFANKRIRASAGAEIGGFATAGDYHTQGGQRDYHLAVAHVAGLIDIESHGVTARARVGPAYGEFEVEGQSRTLTERGFGGVFGIEARYALAPAWDLFARGTWFRRSSLDSSWGSIGLGLRPVPEITLEIGYGIASNQLDSVELFAPTDSADVETQGLLLNLTLGF